MGVEEMISLSRLHSISWKRIRCGICIGGWDIFSLYDLSSLFFLEGGGFGVNVRSACLVM